MPAFIGIALALAVCAFARGVRFDRDRAFYPAVVARCARLPATGPVGRHRRAPVLARH